MSHRSFGVYSKLQRCLVHIGFYEDEDHVWQIYLGWPSAEEIAQAKTTHNIIPITISYDPQ